MPIANGRFRLIGRRQYGARHLPAPFLGSPPIEQATVFLALSPVDLENPTLVYRVAGRSRRNGMSIQTGKQTEGR